MSTISQNLGKVMIVHQGEYDETVTYERLDVVSYNGSSYLAIQETTGNLPTDTDYWKTVALKGDTYELSEEDWNNLKTELTDTATSEFMATVNSETETFNSNAEVKLSDYNSNAETLTNDYNTNASSKLEEYNTNAETLSNSYNTNATEKLQEYNDNATSKVSEYDTNATTQLNTYNTNATTKLSEYNTNAETKVSAYDSNATTKINEYNTNATTKTEEFDANAQNKLDEFNTNADGYERKHNWYRYNFEEEYEAGTEITLPCEYELDSNLMVYFCSERLIKDEDYTEVSTTSISLNFDVSYSDFYEKYLDLLVKEVISSE